jgi:hypothetical protein
VRTRLSAVHWAPMPEATVDKDRDSGSREHNVCTTTDAPYGCYGLSESVSASMQLRAKGQLGPSVDSLVALHHRANSTRRWRRWLG